MCVYMYACVRVECGSKPVMRTSRYGGRNHATTVLTEQVTSDST